MADPTISPLGPFLPLEPTMGALYIGAVISVMFFGFTTNLAFDYSRRYIHHDAFYVKVLVVVLWLMDAFQVSLIMHMSYTYIVKGYFNPNALTPIVWSLALEIAITVAQTFLVRLFYISQVWGISSRNFYILGGAFIFAVGQLALGVETTVHLFQHPVFATFSTPFFRWIFASKCVSSATADLLITLTTCYYLHNSRTGFTKTNEILHMLFVYTINRGVLATIWEGLVLIVFLATQRNYGFITLHLLLGKIHLASIYTLLNHRDTLRLREIKEEPSKYAHVTLPGSTTSNPHGSNNASAVARRESLPDERRNVQVMVENEVVVDQVPSTYVKRESNDFYPAEPVAW